MTTGSVFNCATTTERVPLVAHVIYRLDVGGLENGLINIINELPEGRFRHAIICLTDYSDYHKKIRPQVELIALHKKPGHDFGLYWRLYKTLRRLQPDIIHTRNLATLEAQVPAWLARVKRRLHGLHGWDMTDLKGENRKYQQLYRFINPLIHRYIPLSNDLENYLLDKVDTQPSKIVKICNGVDTRRFSPGTSLSKSILPPGFAGDGVLVIGTVGRLEVVKDQLMLVNAFIELVSQYPELRERVRLVLVGDGSMRETITARLAEAGIASLVWMTGSRNDVADLLRAFDIFVLPSKAEGISNTLLEAMATGVPVVATDVGGNAQLVNEGVTGFITPGEAPEAMAEKLYRYISEPLLLRRHALAARESAEQHYSLQHMVKKYQRVYEELLS